MMSPLRKVFKSLNEEVSKFSDSQSILNRKHSLCWPLTKRLSKKSTKIIGQTSDIIHPFTSIINCQFPFFNIIFNPNLGKSTKVNNKPNPNNVCKEKIFNEIFKSHAKDLHDFLYYKYGEDNSPQDIVQVAFEKLWKNCRNIPPGKAKSFLFTVANNEMINSISRKKTVLNFKLQKPKNYTDENPEFLMEEKEYHVRLQKALEELSEDQRVTFMLNRVEGKKHREIAEILGISQKAVEKRIYTALSILQEKVGIKKI